MTTYYAAMAALALISFIIFLLLFREKKLNYYMFAFFAIVSISNAGALALAMADTLGEAVIAHKIYYMGSCFIPPISLLVIFKLCNISIKKWHENVLVLYSLAVYGTVLTIGYNEMYYVSVDLIKKGDATALTPQYGFFHNFFYVLLYGYLLIGVVVLLYSLKNKNQVSRKNLWSLIGMEIMTILIFLISRLLNLDVEIPP